MSNKQVIIVNPTFREDIDDKLFKNRADNKNIQDTLLFNDFMTRLSIYKGDLALFPELGLKQHVDNLGFDDKDGTVEVIQEFEDDIENQLKRTCNINYSFDIDDRSIMIEIEIDGLNMPVTFKKRENNSIKIINSVL